ncbi:hypothetical protein PMAYCL1PPCAC_03258, partial [Pristionchus mayeri]
SMRTCDENLIEGLEEFGATFEYLSDEDEDVAMLACADANMDMKVSSNGKEYYFDMLYCHSEKGWRRRNEEDDGEKFPANARLNVDCVATSCDIGGFDVVGDLESISSRELKCFDPRERIQINGNDTNE